MCQSPLPYRRQHSHLSAHSACVTRAADDLACAPFNRLSNLLTLSIASSEGELSDPGLPACSVSRLLGLRHRHRLEDGQFSVDPR